jgi:cytochrome c biogenesis protein CcmG, thiol:disulfide interchange protein DsbE
MRSNRTVHLLVAAALVALAVLAGGVVVACGSSASASASADVQFISVDDFDVADYAGKPLVVNYFGSWCPPCNLEAPELASWTKSHPDAQIVGVAVEDTEDAAAGFMGKYGLSYPIVLDPQWSNANDNGVTGVPETVFYDAKGKEVDRIIGATTEAQLDLSYAKAAQ